MTFKSCVEEMRQNHAYVVYCFIYGGNHLYSFLSNIFIDFSQTTWNFHTQFHHVHQKNMTQLLVPKSQCLKKKWGMMLWIMSGTFKEMQGIKLPLDDYVKNEVRISLYADDITIFVS